MKALSWISMSVLLYFVVHHFTILWMVRQNQQDCDEAGRRLRGTSVLQSMPLGVRDVCLVTNEKGETVPIQMR